MRRRLRLRQEVWPDLKADVLWDRSKFTGFTTIPRTLSLIARIIDTLDKKTAGPVYFDMWCRSFDDYVLEVRDEYEAALASGYEGQRAIRTWRERVRILEDHGFIKATRLSHGPYRLVLILDPHPVVETLNAKQLIRPELMQAYRNQLVSIGAV